MPRSLTASPLLACLPACLQNDVMYNGIRAQGPAASLFFILVIVVGQYMVLNLFLAVLLSNFDDGDEEEEEGEGKAGSGGAGGADVQDDSAAHWQMVTGEDDGKGSEVSCGTHGSHLDLNHCPACSSCKLVLRAVDGILPSSCGCTQGLAHTGASAQAPLCHAAPALRRHINGMSYQMSCVYEKHSLTLLLARLCSPQPAAGLARPWTSPQWCCVLPAPPGRPTRTSASGLPSHQPH